MHGPRWSGKPFETIVVNLMRSRWVLEMEFTYGAFTCDGRMSDSQLRLDMFAPSEAASCCEDIENPFAIAASTRCKVASAYR